jgi:hypothetical protein
MGITWRVSYEREELLALRGRLGSSPGFCGVHVAYLFNFLCCVFCFYLSSSCVLYVVSFYTPFFKTGRIMVCICPFHMSRSNLRTPLPIHCKFHRVIGIDGLTVCILYGEISNFHTRVMGLYSSNCRRFFVCRAVNWEPLDQWTSNFAQLLELIVLRSVYFMVKFRFFIQE